MQKNKEWFAELSKVARDLKIICHLNRPFLELVNLKVDPDVQFSHQNTTVACNKGYSRATPDWRLE